MMQALATDTAPALLGDILTLQPGRAHEFCGPARRTLATWVMAGLPAGAPVIWIRPRWSMEHLHPQGLCDWASPEGLITLTPQRDPEALGCAEQALRSGAVALVVIELAAPPALTPLRRLHLAAETGLARRRTARRDAALLGLVLTPENGGAPGVESRWHLASCPPMAARGDRILPAWRLERLRARMAPRACWHVSAMHAGRGGLPNRLATVPVPEAQ